MLASAPESLASWAPAPGHPDLDKRPPALGGPATPPGAPPPWTSGLPPAGQSAFCSCEPLSEPLERASQTGLVWVTRQQRSAAPEFSPLRGAGAYGLQSRRARSRRVFCDADTFKIWGAVWLSFILPEKTHGLTNLETTSTERVCGPGTGRGQRGTRPQGLAHLADLGSPPTLAWEARVARPPPDGPS